MDGCNYYQLNLCYVLFPPDRLFQFWFKGSQEKVKIHESMNKKVDNTKQNSMTAGHPTNSSKGSEYHEKVMITMQERQMTVVLFQNDE